MYDQHIILDFEMNPVSKKNKEARRGLGREIIEIGAVKLNSRYEVVDKFSCLIKPEYSSGIADYITKLTGIRTNDVYDAVNFEDALNLFNEWIGEGRNRIYSWSDADLRQIRTECEYKKLMYPKNITRWVDFQILFPKLMGLNDKSLMGLSDAANWYGIDMDCKAAHRALYDAEITSELIKGVLTGEYKDVSRKIHQYYNPLEKAKEVGQQGTCLGDLFGDLFRNFAPENQVEISR